MTEYPPANDLQSHSHDRSVLVAANYNAWPEAFNGQCFSFLNVVQSVERATVLAPGPVNRASNRGLRPPVTYLTSELLLRSYSQLRHLCGLPRSALIDKVALSDDYDVFFFMCQFPNDLSTLTRIKNWRARTRIAVAFVLETWSHLLPSVKAELRLLDEFDHVFVLNASSIPNLKNFTSAPITFLPTGADCLLCTPFPNAPARSVDVYSIGRRSAPVHSELVSMARQSPAFCYVYDAYEHGAAIDWADARLLTASLITRSKYFVTFDPRVGGDYGPGWNEEALSTRYFEGAAGGAVLLGSAPGCPEFTECFDWDNALVPLKADGSNVREVLFQLAENPRLVAEASHNNVLHSLRRHDWGHRWHAILRTIGLPPSDLLTRRLSQLEALAVSLARH